MKTFFGLDERYFQRGPEGDRIRKLSGLCTKEETNMTKTPITQKYVDGVLERLRSRKLPPTYIKETNMAIEDPGIALKLNELLPFHPDLTKHLLTLLQELPADDLLCLVDLHRWEYGVMIDEAAPSGMTAPKISFRTCKHCHKLEKM